MAYDSAIHHRRSIRLQHYDYSAPGAYFVTICVHERRFLFGSVKDGAVVPSEAGKSILQAWEQIPTRFPSVDLDAFVLMPNHVHGIIVIGDALGVHGERGEDAFAHRSGEPPTPHGLRGTSDGSLSRVLQGFKSLTTNLYIQGVKEQGWPRFNEHVWQPNFYEHIVRDDAELRAIRDYIETNPARWDQDAENPLGNQSDDFRRWIAEMSAESMKREMAFAGKAARTQGSPLRGMPAGGGEEGRTQGSPLRGEMSDQQTIKNEVSLDVLTKQGKHEVCPYRMGHGYDLHRLQPGGRLMLGGILVSEEISPIAHSDGDVVLHAIVDALLGAMALGDIGEHFPNNDPRWRDAPSRVFVEDAFDRVRSAGYRVQNLDVTILAERPKLKSFKPAIAQSVAALLDASPDQINIKAGTNEGCDAIGRGEAIAAHAVVLLGRGDR